MGVGDMLNRFILKVRQMKHYKLKHHYSILELATKIEFFGTLQNENPGLLGMLTSG